MVTVNGNSPANDRIGELNFTDEDGTPIIILCYVQVQPIKGHDDFVLISNDTLDDIRTDINYHSGMSRHVGIVPVRRLAKQPYHHCDTSKRSAPKSDQFTEEQNSSIDDSKTSMFTVEATENKASCSESCRCTCQARIAELLSEVDFLKITGRRMRKSRKGRDDPKKDKTRLNVTRMIHMFHV
jgi:hypothetical protein